MCEDEGCWVIMQDLSEAKKLLCGDSSRIRRFSIAITPLSLDWRSVFIWVQKEEKAYKQSSSSQRQNVAQPQESSLLCHVFEGLR